MGYTFVNLNDLEVTESLLQRYSELIFQLTNQSTQTSLADLHAIQRRTESELLLCALDTQENLCGLVQGTLIFTPPHPMIYINSVVVHKDQRGAGLGTELMIEAERRFTQRWPQATKVQFTSSPSRGTRGFYERLGYTARVPENKNETTVFFKPVK